VNLIQCTAYLVGTVPVFKKGQYESLCVGLKIGNFRKEIGSIVRVLKCGAGEG
jgi:hypothetical protein